MIHQVLNITKIKPGMILASGNYFIVLEYEYKSDIHVSLTVLSGKANILLSCMKTNRVQINNIKPGDVVFDYNCFIILDNVLIDLFGVAYKLTVLNKFGDVVVIICGNDQYYQLLVV
jgi:hypothetical protein